MTAKSSGNDAADRARSIQLVALDIDGTLTDGRIVIGARGEIAKFFSVHDGQGLRLLMDTGIHAYSNFRNKVSRSISRPTKPNDR